MAVTKEGIYFLAPQADSRPEVQFLDFRTERITNLVKLEKPSFFGLAVSPDRRSLVYSQRDRSQRNILLLKNFQ